jgi:Peptidase A4 family
MKIKSLSATIAVLVAAGAAWAVPTASAATQVQEAASANWSGYVTGAASDGSTRRYSSVSGSWTEPATTCTSGQGYSAFWVGLGGSGSSSNDALEQVGTEADCGSTGSATHFAWYELVPAAPVRLDLTISAGDRISSNVTVQGTNVTTTLTDQTTGQSVTKQLQMSNPDVSSAEWIAEAPSTCAQSGDCQPLPLANFGTVKFTDATATADGHTGTISDPSWSTSAVALNGSSQDSSFASLAGDSSSAGATPSSLSSDGSAFSVAWQADASQASGGFGGGGDTSGYGAGAGAGDGSGYGGWGYGDSGYGDYGYGYGASGSGWGAAGYLY